MRAARDRASASAPASHPHAAPLGSAAAPSAHRRAAAAARRRRRPTAPASSAAARARAPEDAFLAVERHMIQVLRDQHLREKARGRDTLVDDVRRHGRLDQPLAAAADPFAADMALDREDAGRVVELLAHILADALQTAAAAALGVLGLVADLPAREDCRQRHAARLFLRRRRRLLSRSASISRLMASISASMLSSRSERCTASSCSLRRSIVPALQGRHLVRELVDLQLLVL